MDEPTQMPMVSSILFFIAIHTEVTCSAALAYHARGDQQSSVNWGKSALTTMGSRISPMNGLGMWYRVAVSSMDATTASQQHPSDFANHWGK